MQNFRRGSNQRSDHQYKFSNPKYGNEKRRELVRKMSMLQQTMIASQNTLQKAVPQAIFFVCVPTDSNSHIVAIETGTPVRMRAIRISFYENIGDNMFLPCYIGSDEFVKTYNDYIDWSVSKIVNISYGNNRNEFKIGNGDTVVSNNDVYNVYISLLHGTIQHYYQTNSDEDIEMIWLIVNTIRHILKKYVDHYIDYVSQSYTVMERFTQLFKNRDDSISAAKEFNMFVSSLHPCVYNFCLFVSMVAEHDIVHKSSVVDTSSLLGGLFAMHSIGDCVSIDGIDDPYLRVLYERSNFCFNQHNLNRFLDIDQLVQYLHENASGKFVNYLKYNAFFVMLYRNVFMNNDITYPQFIKLIKENKNFVSEIRNGVEASVVIAPNCNRYLSNENFAEFVVRTIQNCGNSKFKILTTNMFNSRTETPELVRIVQTNHQRVRRIQEQSNMSAVSATNDVNPTNDVHPIIDDFARKCTGNVLSPVNMHKFKMIIFHIVRTDTHDAIEKLNNIIKYFDQDQQKNNTRLHYFYICRRTIMKIIRYCCIRNGIIHNWLNKQCFDTINNCSVFGKNHNDDIANIVNLSDERINELEHKIKEYDNIEQECVVLYEAFESSLNRCNQRMKQYLKNIGAIFGECPICFNNRQMVALHGDTRHSICVDCKKKISNECPFCRCTLNDRTNDDSDDSGDSDYSDY
jgi:hypothetical protein